ncbi:MAG: TIGR04083 family peptide-modifying radical SAM enzyme, partial [Anaerolineae bacterium]|nr:TIGR04083 family peptide-modifying radical SAM enzyme [Anaerolineae bacterium]
MSDHFMLIPSLACQAACAYCFGPNQGPTMSSATFDTTTKWIDSISGSSERVDLTFHGGEPLLAGKAWYARQLGLLRSRFGKRLKLSIQSNLWLLDDDFCSLFKEYDVAIGTSLDGPREINDRQRGKGYFDKTMAGIERARRNGMSVGVICTLTRLSAPHYQQVFDFFSSNHLAFSVHAAVATLEDSRKDSLAMSPQAHADLFVRLFDTYMEHITEIQITTFDAMAKSISAGKGGICTFTDCLGDYMTVGPQGGIYSCNRFAGHPEWRLGSVQEQPDRKGLARSPIWTRLQERQAAAAQACGDCAHFAYCRGGCAYNAVTHGSGARDPHCTAYKQLFDHIADRALEQVFSEQNLDAVVSEGPNKHGLMRKGKLLQIMRDGPHPRQVARQARELVAAVALGASASPQDALSKLDRAGIVTLPKMALQSLTMLRNKLDTQSQQGLVNAYLHITYACNLRCKHCYARSAPGRPQMMGVKEVVQLVQQAAAAGFRKVVITGGEPMAHQDRDALLAALAGLRQTIKPAWVVLRTNLAYHLTPTLVDDLAHSTDQVVVSVDGDEASHDARRGAGSYARTVGNLKALLAAKPTTEIGIAAVLTAEQMGGAEGDTVRALGDALDVRVRFKSVLPLGR